MANGDLQAFLETLRKNLNILEEQQAKYGMTPPVGLLNQIDDYGEAIAEVKIALEADSPPGAAELEAKFESLILGINTPMTERSQNDI